MIFQKYPTVTWYGDFDTCTKLTVVTEVQSKVPYNGILEIPGKVLTYP